MILLDNRESISLSFFAVIVPWRVPSATVPFDQKPENEMPEIDK